MAFQIVDDILDFTGASAVLGKPAQADMQLGLATAPILYASESNKDLIPLIQRRFKEKGDVQSAIQMAVKTNSVEKYKPPEDTKFSRLKYRTFSWSFILIILNVAMHCI